MEVEVPERTTKFSDYLLSRFSESKREKYQRLCLVVSSIAQELEHENLPSTATAFFGASCTSLDSISCDIDPSPQQVDSLMAILFFCLPRISESILSKKKEYVTEIVLRFVRLSTMPTGVVISGLKCLTHVMIFRQGNSWSEVAYLYGVLLGFMIDSRPKVRRQCHLCVRDALHHFQRSSLIVPASEGISSMFEKFLLFAGESKSNANEGNKGAQEVIYFLDAFKECLLFMSAKHISMIFKYFKKLLDLHQSIVTKRICDSLSVLCLAPSLELSDELLLDLLYSLACSASNNKLSIPDLTFTARLLGFGMRKLHFLNRQMCVAALPSMMSALKDILASKHDEAVHSALEAISSLINDCIDEDLINEGVQQIMSSRNIDEKNYLPTVIEKFCAVVESLLDFHFFTAWNQIFPVISVMFNKLGRSSCYLLHGTFKSLVDIQSLPDEEFPCKKQLYDCLGFAVGAMGPENFLSLLPFKWDADDLIERNSWLFPVLKHNIVGASLCFFTDSILDRIIQLRKKSQKLALQGKVISARKADGLVHLLWSLFPSFCNYPLDTKKSFINLGKVFHGIVAEDGKTRGIICYALQILIQQNKGILDGKSDMSCIHVEFVRQQVEAYYTRQVAVENLKMLSDTAHELFTVLSVVLGSPKDGGCVHSTISEFASIADKGVISSLFVKTMHGLLQATQMASNEKATSMQIDSSFAKNASNQRAQLFSLAVSLLPGLDSKEIDVLFAAVKPALKDEEAMVQKKAYKVLAIILHKCEGFISSRNDDMLQLMIETMPSCHFSAKRHRLDCLYHILVHLSKDTSDQRKCSFGSFLTEIILALKEANKRTRVRAYDLLVQIGHAYGDEEAGGRKDNLYQFFNMVAGGLTGETPHMISAAMKGLARLAYEFSDLVSSAYKLLPSTFLLFKRENREIIKANLGLLKVLVVSSPVVSLQSHLQIIVEGLLSWQNESKNHFKAKIKHLVELLVKKCGLDAVKAVMPEGHMKLLTNIRKINERKERKSSSNSDHARSQLSRAASSRFSSWNSTKIFSDFGESTGGKHAVAKTSTLYGKRSSRHKDAVASSRVKRKRGSTEQSEVDTLEQSEDEPLDLLDQQKLRSSIRSSKDIKRQQQVSDDEPEFDPDGRLIVSEKEPNRRKRHVELDSGTGEDTSVVSVKQTLKDRKRRKMAESGWSYTGSEYATKKGGGGGDMKRKDKVEPYAYWPLDRKMLSRRTGQRAIARRGMSSVVKMAKRMEGMSASAALSMNAVKLKRTQKKGKKLRRK